MKDFIGGIDPNASVNVLMNETRTVKRKKLKDLKAGERLGQAGSDYYVTVNEVRLFRRQMNAFRITLESGEKLTAAEGTILCGQYGSNFVSDEESLVLCLANMGRFLDTEDSRRTFKLSFKSPEKHVSKLKPFCRHSSTRTFHGDLEKKFYGYADVRRFLRKLQEKLPAAIIVLGLEIKKHYKENLYDICKARGKTNVFFPLFRLSELGQLGVQYTPALLAYCSRPAEAECRKVVSCEKISSDGPWAFPVFDDYDEFTTPSHQRFSFTANGFPVFYPSEFIDRQAARLTLPKEGQPQLIPIPSESEKKQRDPVCWDLDSVYEALSDMVPEQNDSAVCTPLNETVVSLFNALQVLADGRADKSKLIAALGVKVIALHRARISKS